MLDECVTTLIGVQDAIRERLEGKQDADFSTGLLQIAGALEVATQADAALLTGKLERALNASLANAQNEGGEPPNLLDLADAVAALELFLTGNRDDQGGTARFLDVMRQRLEGLPEAGLEGEPLPETEVKHLFEIAAHGGRSSD